jgi:hypothetical protein
VEAVAKLAKQVAKKTAHTSLDDLPHVPSSLCEKLIDRIEAGSREGVLDITCEQLGDLLCCLMPEEFQVPPTPPPTSTPPRSASRIEVYAERVRQGLAIFNQQDAGDSLNTGLRAIWMGGPNGAYVKDWADKSLDDGDADDAEA